MLPEPSAPTFTLEEVYWTNAITPFSFTEPNGAYNAAKAGSSVQKLIAKRVEEAFAKLEGEILWGFDVGVNSAQVPMPPSPVDDGINQSWNGNGAFSISPYLTYGTLAKMVQLSEPPPAPEWLKKFLPSAQMDPYIRVGRVSSALEITIPLAELESMREELLRLRKANEMLMNSLSFLQNSSGFTSWEGEGSPRTIAKPAEPPDNRSSMWEDTVRPIVL